MFSHAPGEETGNLLEKSVWMIVILKTEYKNQAIQWVIINLNIRGLDFWCEDTCPKRRDVYIWIFAQMTVACFTLRDHATE